MVAHHDKNRLAAWRQAIQRLHDTVLQVVRLHNIGQVVGEHHICTLKAGMLPVLQLLVPVDGMVAGGHIEVQTQILHMIYGMALFPEFFEYFGHHIFSIGLFLYDSTGKSQQFGSKQEVKLSKGFFGMAGTQQMPYGSYFSIVVHKQAGSINVSIEAETATNVATLK